MLEKEKSPNSPQAPSFEEQRVIEDVESISYLKEVKSAILSQNYSTAVPYAYESRYNLHLDDSKDSIELYETYSPKFLKAFLFCIGCDNLSPRSFTAYSDDTELFKFNRPFSLGGCCCCFMPHSSEAVVKNFPKGEIIEELSCDLLKQEPKLGCQRWLQHCCMCTSFYSIYSIDESSFRRKVFNLQVNRGCFGEFNNCCSPSPCKKVARYRMNPVGKLDEDVLIKRVYSSTGTWFSNTSNYVFDFPDAFDPEERILILLTILHLEMIYFDTSIDG
eukprot:snap_masked-scaffold_23-processed-gene-3.31-mRNA-1 protein AED:1.00 eAED:1.00 QI:0/0/0/0/1/1/2/0/274